MMGSEGQIMDSTHPVDEVLPPQKLAALGLQHVLVMYAGAVAVPLIIGRALKLSPEQIAFLINADLFCCGLVTLIQSFGMGKYFGIRLPVMMGVTFAAVGPMVAMAGNPELGILGIFGAVIAAGIFTMLIAPFISGLLPMFPPVVTGSIILMIGISLMRIGVNWAAGAAAPTLPGYGDLTHLGMADLRDGGDLADHAFHHRVSGQCLRADRHRGRLYRCVDDRQDEFWQGCQRRMVRAGLSLCLLACRNLILSRSSRCAW